MLYIFDMETFRNVNDSYEKCVIETDDLRKTTKELLQKYYELRSDYGDPVKDIIRFVSDSRLETLLEEYSYEVFHSKKGVLDYIEMLKKKKHKEEYMLLDFDYRKMFELCKAYAWIGGGKQKIVEFLFERDYFEGNFTDLTIALGDKKKNTGNVRKELLILQELGMVCICYDNEKVDFDDDGNILTPCARPKAFFLVDGWYDMLIKHYHAKDVEPMIAKRIKEVK